jgi:hypothetical protein
MVAVETFPSKIPAAEPGIEPGTSWLVVRGSDHQATMLVIYRSTGGCFDRYKWVQLKTLIH